MKKTSEVFGISNTILTDSYVDRGDKDEWLIRYLERSTHIALRGESKCGKSWLRKKNIPNAIVVQCRFGTKVIDIYRDALSQLDIKLIIENENTSSLKGRIETESEFGLSLFAKIKIMASGESEKSATQKVNPVGKDINDLKFIADIIIASERRLVIEDFHYLSIQERRNFSFEMKSLWDYGCFIIIIGVWSQSNMLLNLNPDLSGRLIEESIFWTPQDLGKVIQIGSNVLKIELDDGIKKSVINNCFGNVGILQTLMINILDEANIFEEQVNKKRITDISIFKKAALKYAEQLNSIYISFAKTLSVGIRNRPKSTGIYAHAMAAIIEAADEKLLQGLPLDEIYGIAHSRQDRIKKGNLNAILKKLEELQVDKDGRGLIIAYDISCNEITAVDRQLLFFRKYKNMNWPWEELILESANDQLEEDE